MANPARHPPGPCGLGRGIRSRAGVGAWAPAEREGEHAGPCGRRRGAGRLLRRAAWWRPGATWRSSSAPRRAEQIARHGLRIESKHGNADLRPRTVLAGRPGRAVRPRPARREGVLARRGDGRPRARGRPRNGDPPGAQRHAPPRPRSPSRFGPERVLGGVAQIPAALGPEGQVRPPGAGPRPRLRRTRRRRASGRVRAVAALCEGAKFSARASEQIVQEMWEKWVVLATLAGMTCLMRASVGDILAAPGGREALLALLGECRAVGRGRRARAPPRGRRVRGRHADAGGQPAHRVDAARHRARRSRGRRARAGRHGGAGRAYGRADADPAARALPRRRLRGPPRAGAGRRGSATVPTPRRSSRQCRSRRTPRAPGRRARAGACG